MKTLSGFPPAPEFGTFFVICHNCVITDKIVGWSNEFDNKKPICQKCKKEMSIINFQSLDPDADVDAT